MIKNEQKTITVKNYYSDISGKKINRHQNYFNRCVVCGQDFKSPEETGETADDGSLCIKCTNKGLKFNYDDGVGIVDANNKTIPSPYL